MSKAILCSVVVLFALASCKNETAPTTTTANPTTTPTSAVAVPSPTVSLEEDTKQIAELTKKMYTWVNTVDMIRDFDSDPTTEEGEKVKGLDLKKHQRKIEQLKTSGFFGSTFISNYDKIAMCLHKELADGKREWIEGDMAPFEGADPWTQSQDTPMNYWEKITIDKVSINNNVASFVWTSENFGDYKAQAEKENGVWKISYLEGFDSKSYCD
jgi:hypothetical protein